MSAMHAGVMTTSTEMMYAQHVTLTWCPIREAWTACTRRRGRAKQRKQKHTEICEYACRARTQWYSFYSSSAVASRSQQATANRVSPTTAVPVPYQYMVGRLSNTVVGSGSAGRPGRGA